MYHDMQTIRAKRKYPLGKIIGAYLSKDQILSRIFGKITSEEKLVKIMNWKFTEENYIAYTLNFSNNQEHSSYHFIAYGLANNKGGQNTKKWEFIQYGQK